MSGATFQDYLREWLGPSGSDTEPVPPEDDVRVRRCSEVLRTARPVAKSSSHTVTGTFAKRDHTVVEIESGMEFAYAEILDADPRVKDFRTQAAPFGYAHEGGRRETYFDFDIDLVDDSTVYAAVKPKARQAASGICGVLAKVREEHARPDRRFLLVDEDHLADYQIRNARLTNRALREDEDEAADTDRRVLDCLVSYDLPLQVVDIQIALDLHGRTLTSVARLVRRGAVQPVGIGELTIASVVVPTEAGRRWAKAEASGGAGETFGADE